MHKTFRDLFNDTKLQRAKKRTSKDVEEEEESKAIMIMRIKDTQILWNVEGLAVPVLSRGGYSVSFVKSTILLKTCIAPLPKKFRNCAVLLNDNKLNCKTLLKGFSPSWCKISHKLSSKPLQ